MAHLNGKPGHRDLSNQTDISAVNHFLFLLDAALEEERRAINELEEESLQRCGSAIQSLLEQLTASLPARDSLLPEQAEELQQAIGKVKQKREDNRRLMEEAIQDTGRAVGKAAAGRKILKAYYTTDSRAEIFLKKKC